MAARKSATLFLFVMMALASAPWSAAAVAPAGLYSVASNDDQLRVINRATGATLSSAAIRLAGETVQGATGLAKDPTTGLLYALLKLQSAPACSSQPGPGGGKQSRLVTIDPATGNATNIGTTGDCFAGITFHLVGILYGVTGDGAAAPSRLYTLNKSTGAKTQELKALSNPPGTDDGGEAIAFNPNDGLIYRMSGFNTQVFETINPDPATGFAIGAKTLSGDGYIESLAITDIPGNANTLLFTDNANLFTITTGGAVAVVAQIDHFAKGLVFVDNFLPTPSGFEMTFNGPVGDIQLYGVGSRQVNPSDVTVVGARTGAVKGSLVIDETRNVITFVRTGGILLPDVYTVTLRNFNVNGQPFDGDFDGVPGGDFVRMFVAASPTDAVVVSIPDFAAGPRQQINVPLSSQGFPIRLSEGGGVTSVDFTLLYNSNLMQINTFLPGAAPPPGFEIKLPVFTPLANSTIAVTISVSAPNGFPTGPVEVIRIVASVPNVPTAIVNAANKVSLLEFDNVSLNQGAIAALADDAVHVVAYIGDTTGDGHYSALDGQRVLRVAAGLDSGFAAYPLADPMIVGDVDRNGALNSIDATRILQEAAGIDRPEIPPIPPPPQASPLLRTKKR